MMESKFQDVNVVSAYATEQKYDRFVRDLRDDKCDGVDSGIGMMIEALEPFLLKQRVQMKKWESSTDQRN